MDRKDIAMKISNNEKLAIRKEEAQQLNEAICMVKNPEDVRRFLRDLLTFGEHRELSRRLEIANMLEHGFTQSEISDLLGVGVGTVSRVNAKLKSGSGFKSIIDKLPPRKSKNTSLG